MAISLSSAPPTYAFSGDRIRAEFTIPDIYEATGSFAVNRVPLSTSVPDGTTIVLSYGGQIITMTAVYDPDDSGYEIFANGGGLETPLYLQVLRFQANYILQKDFDITQDGGGILFTAKKKGPGYNMSGFVTSAGTAQVVKPNLNVQFLLYCQNPYGGGFELIYEAPLSVMVSGTATAEAVINDKLHNYITAGIRSLMPDIPSNDPMLCNKSCRKYYFEYAESYGDIPKVRTLFQSAQYTVLHGGMSFLGQGTKTLATTLAPSTIDKDIFLKQGYVEQYTRADQPQYLYYFNTRATVTATLMVKYHFTDGTVASKELVDFSIPQYRKAAFDIQFDKVFIAADYPVKTVTKYEVWLVNPSDARITESRFYYVDQKYKQFARYFLNWSSWGTMDSRMFYGKGSVEFDLVQSEAEKAKYNPAQLAQGSSVIFNSSIRTRFTITTGWIKNKTDLLFNRDFFLSVLKYRLYKGNLLPIKITNKAVQELEDGNNMYAQKFEYEYLYDDNAYTEGDIEKEPDPPFHIIGQVYFGPSASKPLTQADVYLLPNSQAPTVSLMPLYTGTNKIFSVALPAGRVLANAYDNTSDEDVTSEYVPTTIVVDGISYKVYTMQMAIAYTSNHDHIITIING